MIGYNSVRYGHGQRNRSNLLKVGYEYHSQAEEQCVQAYSKDGHHHAVDYDAKGDIPHGSGAVKERLVDNDDVLAAQNLAASDGQQTHGHQKVDSEEVTINKLDRDLVGGAELGAGKGGLFQGGIKRDAFLRSVSTFGQQRGVVRLDLDRNIAAEKRPNLEQPAERMVGLKDGTPSNQPLPRNFEG